MHLSHIALARARLELDYEAVRGKVSSLTIIGDAGEPKPAKLSRRLRTIIAGKTFRVCFIYHLLGLKSD